MRQIIAASLGLNMTELYQRWTDDLNRDSETQVEVFLSRRLKGEPFQYIVGEESFWENTFAVGPGVLIPRPETELMVETLLAQESKGSCLVAELGAGTGNIGISVMKERPTWTWHAFEMSGAAMKYLRVNQSRCLPDSLSYFVYEEDFFAGINELPQMDWIVSNPPYLNASELSQVSKEVQHEPAEALLGGEDGYEVIEKLAVCARSRLRSGGKLFFEISEIQGAIVHRMLEECGFCPVIIMKDLRGLDRFVLAVNP